MNKRQILISSTFVLFIVGLIFSSYPFIRALGLSETALNNSLVKIDLPELDEGKVVWLNIQGAELFILKPTIKQRQNIFKLDSHVWNKATNSFKSEIGAFVNWGISTRWGCALQHKPIQESMLFEWEKSAKWHGGFWDPACEISYDYSGRAIKSYEYTFNGYNWGFPNLKSPTIFKKSGNKYVVSIYQR